MRLRASAGRAVLDDHDGHPDPVALSGELTVALHEWAKVVEILVPKVGQPIGSASADLVTRRGRQLAVRLANEVGSSVDYLDPVHNVVVKVEPVCADAGLDVAAEPTPWGTGLTVSVVAAVVVAIIVVDLSVALVRTSIGASLLGNVLVGCGLIPSVWLLRNVPTLRWIAFGMLFGLVVAWTGLAVELLVSGSAA